MKRLQQILNKTLDISLKPDGIVGPKTKAALVKLFESRCLMPPSGSIICAIRTDEVLTNTFDDYLFSIRNGNIQVVHCSTTPGKYYVRNPYELNKKGVAILKPGIYKNSHRFVTAQNWSTLWLKAPHFRQCGSLTVYRDGNKDNKIDKEVEDIDPSCTFYINIHRGGLTPFIDRWSAGCIVIPDKEWFEFEKQYQDGDIISLILIEV